jgi:N-hydroxyarylamine O-acetyltransferase
MAFDLEAYLARIGYTGSFDRTPEALTALHRAHALAVPFENLDIQMGKPIRLELSALEEKLVAQRRGGYCFEQNTLFLAALAALGFEAIACEARVVNEENPGEVRPRTHMTLVVSLSGRAFLADVGFGADGPVEPVPMDGAEALQLGDTLRVQERKNLHVLQTLRDGVWRDQYVFKAEERHAVDFEVANWYTSTHPRSRFVTTLTAQRVRPGTRHVLRNLAYTMRLGDRETVRDLARTDVLPLLRDVFGIDLPERSRFKALDS